MFDAWGRRLTLVLCAVTATCVLPFQAPTTAFAQGSGLHDVSGSIVDITVHTAAGNHHSCGFVVGAEGLVVTNLSHFNGVENVTIRLASGATYNQLTFYAADPSRDLVVFQVPATGLKPVIFGDSNPIQQGASVQATCCGFDPMCENQWSEVSSAGVDQGVGVNIFRFGNPPVPWMRGAPLLDRRGEVVGIANILIDDQSKIAVTSNDIVGVLQNPYSPPVTLSQYVEFLKSQAAEPASQSGQEDSQQTGWSMAGSWRVPNLNLIYMFVEDQGQLKGKEIFETGGSTESFFILDKVGDTQYKGFHHFLWGCSTKKGALSGWQSKTCQVDWETTVEQLGPGYAVLEYEGFADGLPKPGDKAFKKVCETCGSDLARKKIRYEIIRTQ